MIQTASFPSSASPLGWQAVWKSLGIMATLQSDSTAGTLVPMDGYNLSDAQNDTTRSNIWYRRSRRYQMTIWKASESGVPQLAQSVAVDVYDAKSYHDHLPLIKGGFLGEKSINLSMNDSGTPKSISAKLDSGLSDFLKALGGIPSGLSTALTNESGIESDLQTAHPSITKQQIAELTDQKNLLQLQKDVKGLQSAG
jgi:hypothetical protein